MLCIKKLIVLGYEKIEVIVFINFCSILVTIITELGKIDKKIQFFNLLYYLIVIGSHLFSHKDKKNIKSDM